jgi:hypothetical protein
MREVRVEIVVAALKAQGLVLEEEEPEEVESVTVCCWCAYLTSQQVAGYAAALRPHCLNTGNNNNSSLNSSNAGGSLKA